MSNDITQIDTDILIDIGRNDYDAITTLNKIQEKSKLAISTITEMELIVGCRNKNELKHLEKFLSQFIRLSINEIIVNQTISLLKNYKLSHGLLIPDALIASTSIYFDTKFITKNIKDYRFISDLNLLSYPLNS